VTATMPRSGSPPGVSLRRVRSVYGICIEDPATREVRIDYVGKTKRSVAVREAEHRGLGRNPECEQPWSDLIRGHAVVLESDAGLPAPWTDAELDARERCWIRNAEGRLPHRPRFNIEHGMDHADHIPPWVAREQRAQRDRAQGIVSRWTHPECFTGPVLRASLPQGPSLWSRFWRTTFGRWLLRKLKTAAKWSAGAGLAWSVGTSLLVWADVPARDAAQLAVLGVVAGVVFVASRRRKPKRRNRGRR